MELYYSAIASLCVYTRCENYSIPSYINFKYVQPKNKRLLSLLYRSKFSVTTDLIIICAVKKYYTLYPKS